ncbi:hypothetical protein F5146DRAFT_124955 [Armillaria mellea]|nr:hypothetical protein F5146DRAFT_124955 [Armillaria mellea]
MVHHIRDPCHLNLWIYVGAAASKLEANNSQVYWSRHRSPPSVMHCLSVPNLCQAVLMSEMAEIQGMGRRYSYRLRIIDITQYVNQGSLNQRSKTLSLLAYPSPPPLSTGQATRPALYLHFQRRSDTGQFWGGKGMSFSVEPLTLVADINTADACSFSQYREGSLNFVSVPHGTTKLGVGEEYVDAGWEDRCRRGSEPGSAFYRTLCKLEWPKKIGVALCW